MSEYPASVSGETEGLRYCKTYEEVCDAEELERWNQAVAEYGDWIDQDQRPCHDICVEYGPISDMPPQDRWLYLMEPTDTPFLNLMNNPSG